MVAVERSEEIFLNGQLARLDGRVDFSPQFWQRLFVEKLQEVAFVEKTLLEFELWLEKIADTPCVPFSGEVIMMPRKYGGPPVSFPPALPFLEAAFDTTRLAFSQYERYQTKWAWQTGEALCHLLNLIKKMAENKIKWKNAHWQRLPNGCHVYTDYQYSRDQIREIYYTPGINRFGICWHSVNPYGPKVNRERIFAEMRVESEDPLRGKTDVRVNFSVRQYSREEGTAELTDFVFGSNCHHVRLVRGWPPACQKLLKQWIGFLHVSHIVKESVEVPG